MAAVDATKSSVANGPQSLPVDSLCLRLRCAAFSTLRLRVIASTLRKMTTAPFVLDRDNRSQEGPSALFVQFRNATLRDRFVEDVTGQQIKGEDLTVDEVRSVEGFLAAAFPTTTSRPSRSFGRRRRRSTRQCCAASFSSRLNGSAFQGTVPAERLPKMRRINELKLKRTPRIPAASSESVANRVTPLACYSYVSQVQMKQQLITSCLRGLTRKVFHHFYPRESREALLERKAKEKSNSTVSRNGDTNMPELDAGYLDCENDSSNSSDARLEADRLVTSTNGVTDQRNLSTTAESSSQPWEANAATGDTSGAAPVGAKAPLWCHPKISNGFNSCAVASFVDADCVEARLGYRNKCEFTIGLGRTKPSTQGHLPSPMSSPVRVGFVSQTLNFEPIVSSASGCLHVPIPMQELCYRLQNVIQQNSSIFPVYSRRTREGLWRMAMIRMSNCENSMQLVVQVAQIDQFIDSKRQAMKSSTGSGAEEPAESTEGAATQTAQAIRAELTSLLIENLIFQTSKHHHVVASGCRRHLYNGYSLASVLLNESTSLSDSLDRMDRDNTTTIFGEDILQQQIHGLLFRLGPSTFFQTNSVMCEKLYMKAFELADLSDADLVIDVCCGSGAIALCMHKLMAAKTEKMRLKLIGIEMVASAVADARINAALSGINDVEFFEGRAETVLPSLLHEDSKFSNFRKIVVFVDPPRAGLHRSVTNCILSCPRIGRVVYISCNPDSFLQDAHRLCVPPAFLTEFPFRPSKAVGVDMFPHTYHCEMVTVLDRLKPTDLQSL